MPDEQLPAESGADEATQTQPETDWQKRYTDTHANWNTLNEQLSRFKQDPNAVIEFIRETHPDLLTGEEAEEEEDEFEPDAEEDRPLTRAEFKAWQDEQAQTAQQKSMQQQYETDFQKFVNGRELSPIAERAIRAAPVKNAEELKAVIDEALEYDAARAKPKPRVPHVPTNGQAATDVPNWDDMTPGEINQYMAERVRGHQAQT